MQNVVLLLLDLHLIDFEDLLDLHSIQEDFLLVEVVQSVLIDALNDQRRLETFPMIDLLGQLYEQEPRVLRLVSHPKSQLHYIAYLLLAMKGLQFNEPLVYQIDQFAVRVVELEFFSGYFESDLFFGILVILQIRGVEWVDKNTDLDEAFDHLHIYLRFLRDDLHCFLKWVYVLRERYCVVVSQVQGISMETQDQLQKPCFFEILKKPKRMSTRLVGVDQLLSDSLFADLMGEGLFYVLFQLDLNVGIVFDLKVQSRGESEGSQNSQRIVQEGLLRIQRSSDDLVV